MVSTLNSDEMKKDWRDFRIGDIIECRDKVGKWYEATVCEAKVDNILIHFKGWVDTWDGKWRPLNCF
jgi:hypothetical protein